MGVSFKVAPGVRIRASSRGIRTSEDTDQVAADALAALLDARRVVIRRGDPDHEVVVADVGKPEAPFDMDHLTHLDADGHIRPAGRGQPPTGPAVRWVRAPEGPSSSSSGSGGRSAG
jgi:hypothetical protein